MVCLQGGRLLADHGLRSVVSDEQLHTLAKAEVIPPTYSLLKVRQLCEQ